MLEIVKRDRFMFNPGMHKEYLYNNEPVPSITTILKLLNKSALMGWANHLGWKRLNYKDVVEESATIGTITHHYIEKFLRGELDKDKLKEHLSLISDAIRVGVINALSSFFDWYKENKHRLEVIYTEREIVTKYFAGTIDLICKLDGKLTILDYKTSSTVYYSQFLQLGGYDLLCEQDSEIEEIEDWVILRLDKKSGFIAEENHIDDMIDKYNMVIDKDQFISEYKHCYINTVTLFYQLYPITVDWKTSI